MYKPCPLCNKKKPHYHKGCNVSGREKVTPQKKKFAKSQKEVGGEQNG